MTANSILEHLRVKMGCLYLSDLHSLAGGKRSHMLYLLSQIPKDATTTRDWADIWKYLYL